MHLKYVSIWTAKLSEILISTCGNSLNVMHHCNLCDKNKYLSALGNWAFVTRNVEIPRSWRRCTKLLISGYIIGSPTNDNAQCFTSIPSANRAGKTPGTPEIKSHTYYSSTPILRFWGGSPKQHKMWECKIREALLLWAFGQDCTKKFLNHQKQKMWEHEIVVLLLTPVTLKSSKTVQATGSDQR